MTSPTSSPTRYRVKYRKTAAMRFTSTLDVQRALERTMRRARLDLAYTHGFNPHARLSLGAALPLGFTSECELVDVWLEREEAPESLVEALRREQPPGMEMLDARRVPEGEPALDAQITGCEYTADLKAAPGEQILLERVTALMAKDSLPRERRGKTYDLRPLIERLDVEPGGARLHMRLASRQGATGRPDEVLSTLDLDPLAARICRTRLFLSQADQSLEQQSV